MEESVPKSRRIGGRAARLMPSNRMQIVRISICGDTRHVFTGFPVRRGRCQLAPLPEIRTAAGNPAVSVEDLLESISKPMICPGSPEVRGLLKRSSRFVSKEPPMSRRLIVIAGLGVTLLVGRNGTGQQTVTAAVVAGTAHAQDAAAHREWMDNLGDLQDELREHLVAKSAEKSAATATEIERILLQTQAYWAAKHADDIVNIAQESRTLAIAIATTAKADKLDQAAEAFEKMNARCSACHDLHPEKR